MTPVCSLQSSTHSLEIPEKIPQVPTAQEVFARYVQAVHTRDIEAVRALISERVERSDYAGCHPEMDNKACLVHYIQQTVINVNGRFTVLREEMHGDTFHAELEVRSEAAALAGVERIVGTDIVRVTDGLIVGFRFVPHFSDEQTATFFGRLGIGPKFRR